MSHKCLVVSYKVGDVKSDIFLKIPQKHYDNLKSWDQVDDFWDYIGKIDVYIADENGSNRNWIARSPK